MDAVLLADEVRRRYGETVALDGVSLSVGAGEVVALVGPNGAGKTTLVRALTGTIDHEGSVSLFGDDPRAVNRSRIGLLPQSFDPPARLTARELVTYYGGLYDESRSVADVLADVGLTDTADTRYANLSGGQRRRTCVGTALVNDPDLLVLDEPTTGIDPAGRRALWGLLSGLAAAGTTILLTTHYMEEAEQLADRVGLLADGRLVTTGTPAELVAEHGGESRLVIELARDALADEDQPEPTPVRPDPIVGALADAGFEASIGTIESGAVNGSSAVNGSGEVNGSGGTLGSSGSGDLVIHDVAPEHIGEVVDVLDATDAAYDGLAWSDPDLEDVYLSLTGTTMAGVGDDATTRDATDADGPDHPRDERVEEEVAASTEVSS